MCSGHHPQIGPLAGAIENQGSNDVRWLQGEYPCAVQSVTKNGPFQIHQRGSCHKPHCENNHREKSINTPVWDHHFFAYKYYLKSKNDLMQFRFWQEIQKLMRHNEWHIHLIDLVFGVSHVLRFNLNEVDVLSWSEKNIESMTSLAIIYGHVSNIEPMFVKDLVAAGVPEINHAHSFDDDGHANLWPPASWSGRWHCHEIPGAVAITVHHNLYS